MDMIQSLCPDPTLWRIVLISPRTDRIILHLEALTREAHCPLCCTLSRRIHSHYLRQPWDLVWSGWPVQLYIVARRFFCDCPDCPRLIFSEPFPKILKYDAHRTTRLQEVLLAMAHTGSSEGAARLARDLGYVTCGESLRQLQRQETLTIQYPRVIGLDEFALYKSPQMSYGTVIVDEERHCPIAILDSDQTEPVAAWLTLHPEIEIITRDRDQAYAAAARLARPEATQVADRFHLTQNATAALKSLYKSHSWQLTPTSQPDQSDLNQSSSLPKTASNNQEIGKSTPAKRARWEEVHKRFAAGQSKKRIAWELGMGRMTVRRYLRQDFPPSNLPWQGGRTKIGAFLNYLKQRWEAGCQDGRQLYREILERGYQGKITQVYNAVRSWKTNQPIHYSQLKPALPLARWLLRSQEKLKEEEKTELEKILDLNPSLAKGYRLKEQFLTIIRKRDVSGLDSWLPEAVASGLKPFQGMAASIRQDFEAVKNALLLPWSNAQCEGQICRIKLIKRMGYGRAKVDLLRHRVIHRFIAKNSVISLKKNTELALA
ncbi:MAG: ISL3 family transposase [Dehalococcoidales bacterium]|nr:ISL3 family transposase [Dehalococcoidales bacterium]